jgi:hypothetical protein
LAWANGWIDALLVAEIVERRATGRRKNDILVEQLECFDGQSRRIWVRQLLCSLIGLCCLLIVKS